MKTTTLLATIFSAASIVVAGCSGSNAPGIPSTLSAGPQTRTAGAPTFDMVSPFGLGSCRKGRGCSATLVAPLNFDGRHLTQGHVGSCRAIRLGDAKPYTARRAQKLALRINVTLKPTCAPRSAAVRLFIGVAEIARHKSVSFVPLGALANVGKTWTFSPLGLGIALKPRAKYVFYVVSAPMDASASGNYLLLQPLSFNGTTFTQIANSCYQGDPQDAPPYVAPTSGPLAIAGTVTLTPACVPSPLPSSPPQLYVVAVNLGNGGDVQPNVQPMDYGFGNQAVAVAGPVNVTDNPWNFAPDSPGLTMTKGTSYGFFVAEALPPAPPPTHTFQEVIPLNFDGTNFTIPTISACTTLPTAAPYTATASGALTLANAVSLTPTCTPSSSGSSGSSSSSSSSQLYIVAAVTCSSDGSGSSSSGSNNSSSGSSGSGSSGSGSSSNCSSSSSSGSGSGSSSSQRRPQDSSGNCSTGIMGGGDNGIGLHGFDSSGSGSSGSNGNGNCTVYGYAIAGPVGATANPWVFDPLSPPLQMTAGSQYSFYVGVASGDGTGNGGGDN